MNPETLRAYAIERLTVGSGLDTDFAISADGSRVAFPPNPIACRPGYSLSIAFMGA